MLIRKMSHLDLPQSQFGYVLGRIVDDEATVAQGIDEELGFKVVDVAEPDPV